MDDLTFEYAGVLLGADTDYELTEIDGLQPTDSREDVVEKSTQHGAWVYAQLLKERRVTLEGFVLDNDPAVFQGKIDALIAALLPKTVEVPLRFKMPGWAGDRRVYGVPVKRSYSTDLEYSLGFSRFAVQFLCGDPRAYDDVESTRTGAGVAANDGTMPTAPIATIDGPSTNPRVTNSTTGEFVQVNVTVGSGEQLVIDFAAKTIELDNVSVYGDFDPDSTWWDLQPGNNTIGFTGGGTLELRWRHAWI